MELKAELQKYIESNKLAKKLNQYSVFNHWENIVGPMISKQTVPKTIKNDTLYIQVLNPVWKTELQFMKQDLLKKIIKESKDGIKRIKLI